MIGSSKNKRENYPRKSFWKQEKETRVKFNPGLSANRPSNNWAQSCNWAFAVPYHYIMVFIYYILIAAAGNAFMEAAQLQITLQSKHEAGQRFVDAGNCFKKTDVEGKFEYFLVKRQSWHHSIMCCIQGGIVTEVIEGLTGFPTCNNLLFINGKRSSHSFFILRQNSTNSCWLRILFLINENMKLNFLKLWTNNWALKFYFYSSLCSVKLSRCEIFKLGMSPDLK